MQLVLASTSPYRAMLLERLGLSFRAAAPLCDEDALKDPQLPLDALALLLARTKARSLAEAYAGAYVLGGDQVADLDGEMLGKPHTRENAIAQLTRMRARSHRLWTALVLRTPDGEEHAHVDLHTITLRDLSDQEVARYVDAERPFDCAGSYKIEGRGIALMASIEGGDFTAITGMPLIALTTMLRTCGFRVP